MRENRRNVRGREFSDVRVLRDTEVNVIANHNLYAFTNPQVQNNGYLRTKIWTVVVLNY
jgi:hypothetical protein